MQALVDQKQSFNEALNNAITELSMRITSLNAIPATSSSSPPPQANASNPNSSSTFTPQPCHIRCDMITFDGSNLLDWIFQAEKHFSLWEILEE